MTSSGLFQKKKYLYAFDQCFRPFLDKALQNPENMLKSYLWASHNWKQNWKTPTGSFLLSFLFGQIVEKWLVLFTPYCIISAYFRDYELKFTR